MEYAIECRNIVKRFGSVIANDGVDFTLKFGEILALLGENGSGKTTLMNMLSGIYHPDGGSIYIDGKESHITSPLDAIQMGVGMIHQHFKLVENMSATENIVLGTKSNKTKPALLKQEIMDISQKFQLNVDPDKKIYNMSVSEKQTVEVLKVLYRGARILILDEPTAVLTPSETTKLFAILKKMRAEGCAVIIITHKLNEVMEISDRVTVLRKGKSIDTVITAETNEKQLTEIMVGRAVNLSIERPDIEDSQKESIMSVKALCAEKSDGTKGLINVNFELNTGEILGVAGIAGSGQKELCEVITGLLSAQSGEVIYQDGNILGKSPDEISQMGIKMAFVPEDRLGMGLVGSMGISDNLMLKTYKEGKGLFVHRKPAVSQAEELVKKLDIKTPNTETPIRRLSGGNVQKVLIGREIESDPKILIVAYPVRGLDIHTSFAIYDLLNRQKEKGTAILFIGEDLDVLLEISDRIMVLCHGEVSGILNGRCASKEEVGLLMTGTELASNV